MHATDGAAGEIPPGFPATRETLGAVRRAEDEAAWEALGRPPDRHEWLDYDDGAVSDEPFEELVARIADILAEERPDVVGGFGPDGITGHPDHVRVGAPGPGMPAWCTAQVVARGGPGRLLADVLEDLPLRGVAQGPSSDTVAGSSAPS